MQDFLESESEFIIKEAFALFKNPVILWAGGKDSTTMLTIARKAFSLLGRLPIKVMQLDTTFKFPETYRYMDKYVKDWKLDFIRYQNKQAIKKGVNPSTAGKFECCNQLKTQALARAIEEYNFDAVLVGIRWDEHGVRGKESFFSQRENPKHVRVHPMLNWSEKQIWQYLKKNNVPHNPLYDKIIKKKFVYRSIGCKPCTKPILRGEIDERAGRSLDKEQIMEDLRALGYM